MRRERIFLSWDAPVAARVRDFLLPQDPSGPVDLARDLIVVPTNQAGRRLREALALACAERQTALLSPRVVTSAYFLRPQDQVAKVASPIEVAALWAKVLMTADLSRYTGLLPSRTPRQDFTWAVHMGEMIQGLRDTLADGGYRIIDVYNGFGHVLEELDRWKDLSELESAYLEQLRAAGRHDPYELMIKGAESPHLPPGVERVVVAAVPDPTPLMVRALEGLAERVPVVILIHAPESLADHFDPWGRPIPDQWCEARIDIPDPEVNVILAGSPVSQSRKVLELIAAEAERFGPADIALGVPDQEVSSCLAADLSSKGLRTFDPAGKPVSEHPLYCLLDAFRVLVREGSYTAFSTFLRNADVLHALQRRYSLSPRRVLEELDKFQNLHLPSDVEDILRALARQSSEAQQDFSHLQGAVAFVQDQVRAFQRDDLDLAVRSLLQSIYQGRKVNAREPKDERFIAVAGMIDDTLREFVNGVVVGLGIENTHALDLVLQRLSRLRYYTEDVEAVIALEGWLELPWNDAPFLIVTGMNEGSVPESSVSDLFLPDSLRTQLNLRHDADRLATDSYLMRVLIESRKAYGRACFIAGKTRAAGEPLKPSRLLFLCTDDELPRRAQRLFGDPTERPDNHPSTISFLLDASPPPEMPPDQLTLVRMPVTWFRDYLTCPFRFYLKHVLGMEELRDDKGEMNSMDFGALVHHTLQRMAESDEMRHCGNQQKLRDFLWAEAQRWVSTRFGASLPLQITLQLEAAKQRLDAAARVQVELVRDGWEILQHELDGQIELKGMKVSGRIDRVDRHRDTGRLRILDYKTSDRATNPAEDHLSPAALEQQEYMKTIIDGRERRWANLQLPLYRFLLAEELGGMVELGYFNIPKSLGDTGISLWEGFNDQVLASASLCAEGIIEDIQRRRFWPPASKVTYDDFARLFYDDLPDCIDLEAFQFFVVGQKK